MDQERAVYKRYKMASFVKQESLCCPTSYNSEYLKIIPQEIIEKDYGCGDPSRYVLKGETVLDLGSGGGKLCYIIAQIVGKEGKVIGVDMNSDMLALARKYEDVVAQKLGYKNFEFKRARIQNLKLDLEKLSDYISKNPINSLEDYLNVEFISKELEKESPLIEDESIDVIVSNCVLNLVRDEEKRQLFSELFRVLKKNGRAVISDIVSDKTVPDYMKQDAELWSGCISGAMKEEDFIKAFKEAGFKNVEIIKKDNNPWRVIDGINFYSVTVAAYKGDKKVRYYSCCGNDIVYTDFTERLKSVDSEVVKDKIQVVQINVGGLCNQSCKHCHISAGPEDKRVMERDVMDRIVNLLKNSSVDVADITGGAPELNPHISYLLRMVKPLVKRVIFRTNLTALMENEELITEISDRKVALFASLPSLNKEETDRQRGIGVFEKSINMLKKLNSAGFGTDYDLVIVHNPVDLNLPDECEAEEMKRRLKEEHNILCNSLIFIANAPIGNFKRQLEKELLYDQYFLNLVANFNRETIKNLMCVNLVNIGYDGHIYDCDFNNAAGIASGHINEIETFEILKGQAIKKAEHCYVCTAKKGSSCFGSLARCQ